MYAKLWTAFGNFVAVERFISSERFFFARKSFTKTRKKNVEKKFLNVLIASHKLSSECSNYANVSTEIWGDCFNIKQTSTAKIFQKRQKYEERKSTSCSNSHSPCFQRSILNIWKNSGPPILLEDLSLVLFISTISGA